MRNDVIRWSPFAGWSAPFPAGHGDRTLVLAFGFDDLSGIPEPFAQLAAAYPGATIAGASSSAPFIGDELSVSGMVVSVTTFDTARVLSRSYPLAEICDPAVVARDFDNLTDPPKVALVIADGRIVNGDLLVNGLVKVLGRDVPVYGGLAGDGAQFVATWTLVDGRPQSGYATVVTFHGDDLVVGCGVRGGWQGFGPRRTVTRSDGCVLHELDGLPALDLYKRYLGVRADGLPGTALLFPLSVQVPGRDVSVVRTVLSIDDEAQSITFAGELPVGSVTQLMRANREELISGAGAAAAATEATSGPVLAVGVSCVGRQIVLGERTEEELDAAMAELSPDAAFIGFYSHGEFGPNSDGMSQLHNQTMTIMTLQEVP
jgi:hypothetical protein